MRNAYKKRKEINNSTNKSIKTDEIKNNDNYINVYKISNFPNTSTINKTRSMMKSSTSGNFNNRKIIKNKDANDKFQRTINNKHLENFLQKNNQDINNSAGNSKKKSIYNNYVNNNNKNFNKIISTSIINENSEDDIIINSNELDRKIHSINYFSKLNDQTNNENNIKLILVNRNIDNRIVFIKNKSTTNILNNKFYNRVKNSQNINNENINNYENNINNDKKIDKKIDNDDEIKIEKNRSQKYTIDLSTIENIKKDLEKDEQLNTDNSNNDRRKLNRNSFVLLRPSKSLKKKSFKFLLHEISRSKQ